MEPRHTTDPPSEADVAKIGDLAADAGIRRVHVLAWRDLEDVEAGGSELHIHEVSRQWAAAGIDVVHRTSFVAGQPVSVRRDGYRVVRRAGRYLVFPRAAIAELAGRHGQRDALVEVWNGMPFFSPAWARGPKLVLIHHVHRDMWRMALPAVPAAIGDAIERRLAPPLYRRSRVATLSASAKQDIHELMGLPLAQISVVPPGLDPRFLSAEPAPAADPTVLVVGRLVPVKRIDLVIRAAAEARERIPRLRVVVVGDGYARAGLEAQVTRLGAEDWVDLRGRLSVEGLVAAYREAWVVASASSREGWGMALTEAAAVGVPAVATDVLGHVDAVAHDVSGLLVDPVGLADALVRVLSDVSLRARLAAGAVARARALSWTATATDLMRLLADEARAHRR